MTSTPTKLEAVRLAREQLGDAPSPQLAAFVESTFGLTIQPTIVTVLLASLREREHLELSRRKAQEEMERASAEPVAKKPRRKTQPKEPNRL